MLLIRKHPERSVVVKAVERWKQRHIRPPAVTISRNELSGEWSAKATSR